MGKRNQIHIVIILLVSLVLTGTIGYKFLLDVSLVDALYMTVITISTVGYAEVGVMDTEAKLFSILLIFISIGTVGYLFSTLLSYFLEGDLKTAWRRRKMASNIAELKDHYIICGAGETGQNAKGLITSLSTDAENVYAVLTARQMNKDLYIVSRAIEKRAAGKLKKAGANNTISPNEIGGTRMASLMLRPNVISFLDIITRAGDVVLDLEEVVIFKNSLLIDKQLKEAKIPQQTGLIVLAIKKYDTEELSLNPSSDQVLQVGDTMVVLGREDQVAQLKEIAKDTGKHIVNI